VRVRLSSNALKFVADKGWDVKKTEYLDLVDRLGSNASKRQVVPGQDLP
jgi:hypothetical protein